MQDISDLSAFIQARPAMVRALETVAELELPDGWIGAGFIRNAVWDALHGIEEAAAFGDVDVAFFDQARTGAERDAVIEAELRRTFPQMPWSVKNQARMHRRNGDAPYEDTLAAIARWPETATAVAARWRAGRVEGIAPHGLGDLVDLVVRPTPAFAGRPEIVRRRIREKKWLLRWPRLTVVGV